MKFDREDSVGQYLYARQTDFWKGIVPNVIDSVEDASCEKKDEQTCENDGDCAFSGDAANKRPYIYMCYIFYLYIIYGFVDVLHFA